MATGVRNWFLKTQGFAHDGSLPAMCHAYLNGRMTDSNSIANLESLAGKVSNLAVSGAGQLREFATNYINAFSKGYNYAFGLAAGAMIISLLVYIVFNKHLPTKTRSEVKKSDQDTGSLKIANMPGIVMGLVFIAITAALFHFVFGQFSLGMALGLFFGFVAFIFKTSTKEEKPRVVALLLVFVVVIFFWMSFHQNGLTQTFFARDYTVKEVGPINNIFFNLNSILAFIGCIAGLVLLIIKKKIAHKIIGLAMFAGLGALTYYFVSGYQAMNPISPEIFQSFNPLFIVALTFPVMGIFTWLRNKNIEPSTPRKIGIGMIIAAIGFLIMLVASLELVAPRLIASENMTEWGRVSPAWLISSYLLLTIAELFLSPMGLSFVSKVSPLRFQGLMQGGWLLATATGNKLLFVGGYFWDKIELWQIWAIFVVCCLLSAMFIFSIMKRLERTT